MKGSSFMISRKIVSESKTVVFSPSKWEPQMGYSRGVRRGNMIFVAGTVAADAAGLTVGNTIEVQTDYILKKIEATLAELGASLKDVVRTDTFLTDFSYFDGYAKIHKKYFEEITPVNTTVACARLVNADQFVEISAIAVI
jgi:enamine deaminase RidA (YjgF/YER057c/UK114 family)